MWINNSDQQFIDEALVQDRTEEVLSCFQAVSPHDQQFIFLRACIWGKRELAQKMVEASPDLKLCGSYLTTLMYSSNNIQHECLIQTMLYAGVEWHNLTPDVIDLCARFIRTTQPELAIEMMTYLGDLTGEHLHVPYYQEIVRAILSPNVAEALSQIALEISNKSSFCFALSLTKIFELSEAYLFLVKNYDELAIEALVAGINSCSRGECADYILVNLLNAGVKWERLKTGNLVYLYELLKDPEWKERVGKHPLLQ